MFKEKNVENLQFAVYGGICGVLGFLTIVLLFFANFDCKSDILFIIGTSIASSFLGVLSIFFGLKARRYIQGKSVIILGLIVVFIVWLFYYFGITCN